MFKKVVSFCLSAMVAMSMNVIAGAEAEHWEAPLENMGNFTGSKKCWDLCKKVNKYDDMCKKDIGKTLYDVALKNHGRIYLDFNYGKGEEIYNLMLTRANLAGVYILRCLGFPCYGLFKVGTVEEVIKREFGNVDMTKYAKEPDNNGCRGNGPPQNFLDKELKDIEARGRAGISSSEGYVN